MEEYSIVTGPGYDLVYYEKIDDAMEISLDEVQIQVAQDALGPWFTVFNWGNGIVDTNTNIGAAGYGSVGEPDDEIIPLTNPPLYGTYPYISGIAIDLDPITGPGVFRYVRLLDGAQFDSLNSIRPIASDVDISVDASVSNTNPIEGEVITFAISVTNYSPTTATNLDVDYFTTSGLSYVSNIASHGTFDDFRWIWRVGTLASGETATLNLELHVDFGSSGSLIPNTFVSYVDQDDALTSNDSVDIPITVQ